MSGAVKGGLIRQFLKEDNMRSFILSLFALVLFATSPASATGLHVDGVAQIGAIAGIGGAETRSNSRVEAWKSFGLDQNGTVEARAAGLTVVEGTIDNRAGLGHNAIGTGQDTTLRLYTGSESFSGATLTGPGAATSGAHNVTSGGGFAIGGNGQLTIRD